MNENLKILIIKLIKENNDGQSEKNANGKKEGINGANLVRKIFNEKDYIIKDINKSKKIKKYKYRIKINNVTNYCFIFDLYKFYYF